MLKKSFYRKLIFADYAEKPLKHKVLCHQWENFVSLWNNNYENKSDEKIIGTERLVTLFLIVAQFLSPSIYIRHIFGLYGNLHKNIGVELYVLFKCLFPFLVLKFSLYNLVPYGHTIFCIISTIMIYETILYTAVLIFASDLFATPISGKRNIIMLLIDYVQIVLDFSILYLVNQGLKYSSSCCNSITEIVSKPLDAVYFSIISSLTIGYGDILPANETGKELVIVQALLFLLFGVVFLNFFSSRLRK